MYVPAWILILVALFVVWLLVKQRRQAERFSPFRVTIQPKWRELLDDHLDMTPERWEAIRTWGSAHPDESTRLWSNGITFTVLTPRERGRLTYINSTHVFQTTIDWVAPLTGISWPTTELERTCGLRERNPRIVIEEDADAYKLSIEVDRPEMLNPARRADAKKHHWSVDQAHERVLVARLPLALFDSPRDKRTAKALTDGGWAGPVFNADVFSMPIEIEHRYAHVSFSYI